MIYGTKRLLAAVLCVALLGLTPDEWVHLRVDTTGGVLKTYVDGVLVSTLKDTTFTAGSVGFTAAGSGMADTLQVWRSKAATRTGETVSSGGLTVAGGSGWTAEQMSGWGTRTPGVGWGTVTGSGAALTGRNLHLPVAGYDTVQVLLMNGTDSGTVYLDFSTDGGKTWHSKPFETAFCGEDAFWAFRNGSLEAYTVDMGNVSAWTGTVTDLRLRFTGNTGLVVLQSLTVYAD